MTKNPELEYFFGERFGMAFEKYIKYLSERPGRWRLAERAMAKYLLAVDNEELCNLLDYLEKVVT